MLFKIVVLSLFYVFSAQNYQTLLNLPEGSKCTWNGVDGKCSNIMYCRSARDGLRRNIHPPICGFDRVTPIVCCTDCELTQSKPGPEIFDVRLKYDESSGKARFNCMKFLEDLDYYIPCAPAPSFRLQQKMAPETNCFAEEDHNEKYSFSGQASTAEGDILLPQDDGDHRSRGIPSASEGVDAFRNQYPHMALLGYGEQLETAQWLCGGSIISERYILTAAHCISSPYVGVVRYVAMGILRRTDPPELWLRRYVKRIFPHPEYAPPSKYHDIALLETDAQIDFSFSVLPACLHSKLANVDEANATGWGALGNHRGLSDVLQAVQLQKFDDSRCSQQYPRHRHLRQGYNNTIQMCYGHHEIPRDTCEGDSGGPLQITNDVYGCAYDVIGVTSYGRQCGVTAGSGIYTRVYHYLPWIESIVWP